MPAECPSTRSAQSLPGIRIATVSRAHAQSIIALARQRAALGFRAAPAT